MALNCISVWRYKLMFLQFRGLHWKNNKFFCCAEHKKGIYHDHRVQISTSMILTKVLRPHLDVATDFPVVHHRGRSRAGCSHMTSDLPLGNQWGSSLCLGSPCPLMWWLQAVGFSWTHPPWHPSPLDPLHYLYSLRGVGRETEYGKGSIKVQDLLRSQGTSA